MTNQTIMAFDFGTKNIGVAVGQTITQSANELDALKARDGIPNWQQLEALLNEWKPELIVVGHPLNMDDSESELGLRAAKFSRRLHGRFGYPVSLVDERLSTFEAKEVARQQGHKGDYGDNPIDSLAARLILESYLRSPNNA